MRLVLAGTGMLFALSNGSAAAQCVGDCDDSDAVAIDELVLGVAIAQETESVDACSAFDCEEDGSVPINCLIRGVTYALDGCPCPLAPGSYTVTQVDGGRLTVGTFAPFPFPAGGAILQDVSAARQPECVHDVVVPFPGGFTAPTFCIPAFGFSVHIDQTGCGIGRIASKGGADFTVTEVGDTSDSSSVCNLPHPACVAGADNSVRIDVTVGDGNPDTCSGGTANSLVSIPVHTTTWIEHTSGDTCPAEDGTFDPGRGDPIKDDMLIVEFPQILDFTTDTNSAVWSDLDGDGCAIAGGGPQRGLSSTGTCIDLDAHTVTTAASGPIGSSGGPAFDLTYTTRLPNTFSGPNPPMGSTCTSPPALNFGGSVSRCIK